MKIGRKRIIQSVNYEGVCRTAPATPGLLKRGTGARESDQLASAAYAVENRCQEKGE